MTQTYRENLITSLLAQSPGTPAALVGQAVDILLARPANEASRPAEEEFLRTVQRLSSVIGYGRMIQMIHGEWEAQQPGIASHQRPCR